MAQCPSCSFPVGAKEKFCGRCGAQLDSAGDEPLLGAIIADRYRIHAKVGEGNLGSVYRAEHVRMGKVIALKVLRPELSRDLQMVESFKRVAREASLLASSRTVTLLDFGLHGDSIYIVTEYLYGVDLGTLLQEAAQLSFPRAVSMITQACESLAEAHQREIYHLDLKPENLFLSRTRTGEDFIKVLDYGLVKLIEQRDQEALSGYLSSSPYYLSPEQIRGVEVDARSDIYSLGALLFRMVTGTPPYTARTALGVLQQHLDAEVPDPCAFTDPPLHPEVRRVLQRALAKHPELRYPSMDAFRVDLQAAVDRIKADELPLKLAARQGTGPSPRASQQLAPGENGGPAAGAERLAEEGGGSGLSAGEAASFSRWDTRHEERVPGELLGTRQDILGFQTRLAQRGLLQSWGTLLLMAATLALAGLAWWWLMRS